MKVIRIIDPDEITPLHVVMIGLVAAVLLGSFLLTSGPHREILHDGAVEWGADSPLRAIVEVLNLRFTQTTSKGVEVKALVFGVGAGLAMIALAFALGVRPRAGDETTLEDTTEVCARGSAGEQPVEGDRGDPDAAAPSGSPKPQKVHITPLAAGQFLMLAFVAWALLSPLWSGESRSYALGGAAVLALHLMWTFALGIALNRVAARVCACALLGACALTAVVAIWYHDTRNPTLRASYPIGNPLFLAACLIPGILVAIGATLGSVHAFLRKRRAVVLLAVPAAVVALVVMLLAFYWSRSRGPALGLLVGLGAMAVFALRGRARSIGLAVLAVALALAGAYFVAQRQTYSETGRSQTLRTRLYAWSYALELGAERPLLGGGPGTFVLAGDALAAGEDVLADPRALDARLAHAHNEWLETWCELGSVGIVLLAAALLMTFLAGTAALERMPTPGLRWVLIALLASLLALVVEETTNVGLRMPGLPTAYYTVIGLIWAMSAQGRPRWRRSLQAGSLRRSVAFILAAGLGIVGLTLAGREFQASRAYYQAPAALGRADWDEALRLARAARDNFLQPQQRLDATHLLCAAHLQIAREHQREAFRLEYEARQADLPDERRLALARTYQRLAEESVQGGLSELAELLRSSPSSWNSGLLEHGFYLVLAEFDLARGNEQQWQAQVSASVAAMERELSRRPFDPELALNYVAVAGAQQPLAHLFDVLARPLRHKTIPRGYLDFLEEAAAASGFDQAFGAVFARALEVTPEQPAEQWSDPWAPEKLRLGAVILFTRDLPRAAEQKLSQAARLYDAIRDQAPIGAAECYAELADARLYAHPDHPQRALEIAEQAGKLAPDSEPGRALKQAVRLRTITYHLAGGDEEAAARVFRTALPDADHTSLDAEVGARYWHLAHSSAWRGLPEPPRMFPRWVERAIELNRAYELRFKDGESARVLRGALLLGAERLIVVPFIDYLLQQRSDSPLLRQLRMELDEGILGRVSPGDRRATSQPSEASRLPSSAPAAPPSDSASSRTPPAGSSAPRNATGPAATP